MPGQAQTAGAGQTELIAAVRDGAPEVVAA
ncbi:MAG: hypothetical protein QOI55_876 [Actinomycetota bacterium]|nr:hypothetical protein [Actinomycetota bacterium]